LPRPRRASPIRTRALLPRCSPPDDLAPRLGGPGGIGPGEPFGVEAARAVDRGQPQLAQAGIGEAVGLARRADDDVAALDDDRLIADLERRLPGLDDEHLRVRVPMQLRADTRLGVDEDDRKRHLAVLGPDKLVRVPAVLKFIELDDRRRVLVGHGTSHHHRIRFDHTSMPPTTTAMIDRTTAS
jgi:hypothetical protein